MIQIIPANKRRSTSEQFGEAFGNLAKMGSEYGIGQLQKNELMQQMQSENEALKQKGINLSGIRDPDLRKAMVLKEYEMKLKGMEPDKKSEEKKEVFDTAQKSFNTLAKLLKKGKVGYGSETISMIPYFGDETARDVGEFSSATGGLESALVDMVSRGTLSNKRFDYIVNSLLPKPGDRQKTILGKLRGIAEMIGLDPTELIELEEPEEIDLGTIKVPTQTGVEIPGQKRKSLTSFYR